MFYGWHVPPYLLLLVGTALLDFAVALAIDRVPLEQTAVRRRWLLVSLISNLGVLALFKYGDFAAQAIEDLAALAGGSLRLGGLGLVLPMGISFYTFQTLSYTIDVYRGELRAGAGLSAIPAVRQLLPAAGGRTDRPRQRVPAAAGPAAAAAAARRSTRRRGC